VLPPKRAWSTIAVVRPTAVVAMPRVTAKPRRVVDLTAVKPSAVAAEAKSKPWREYSSQFFGIDDTDREGELISAPNM
jgi:hypothetical protein